MIDLMNMELISCFYFKNKHIDVYRDKHGKYFCRVNVTMTQKKLTSKEVVRWLSNMMIEERLVGPAGPVKDE